MSFIVLIHVGLKVRIGLDAFGGSSNTDFQPDVDSYNNTSILDSVVYNNLYLNKIFDHQKFIGDICLIYFSRSLSFNYVTRCLRK